MWNICNETRTHYIAQLTWGLSIIHCLIISELLWWPHVLSSTRLIGADTLSPQLFTYIPLCGERSSQARLFTLCLAPTIAGRRFGVGRLVNCLQLGSSRRWTMKGLSFFTSWWPLCSAPVSVFNWGIWVMLNLFATKCLNVISMSGWCMEGDVLIFCFRVISAALPNDHLVTNSWLLSQPVMSVTKWHSVCNVKWASCSSYTLFEHVQASDSWCRVQCQSYSAPQVVLRVDLYTN